jgi:hypothetical protein
VQERGRANGKSCVQDRVFHQREWPTLKVAMKPTADVTPPPLPDADAVKARKTRRIRHASPSAMLELVAPEAEETPVMTSLETALHGSVIVERNQKYGEFEVELATRIENMNENSA